MHIGYLAQLRQVMRPQETKWHVRLVLFLTNLLRTKRSHLQCKLHVCAQFCMYQKYLRILCYAEYLQSLLYPSQKSDVKLQLHKLFQKQVIWAT